MRYNSPVDIQQNVILAPFTTFDIGGPADFFVVAHSAEELEEAVKWAKEKSLAWFILGKGANILVGDKGFRGVVIKNESSQVSTTGSELVAESGATIEDLINLTAEKGLSGLEHFAGIPSSVGGALWQNLHFLSPDRFQTVFIGDIVQSAVILSATKDLDSSPSVQNDKLERKEVDKEYFQFAYDYSKLHETHDIVLSATLLLTPEDPQVIQERIAANLKWRAEKHPTNATTCSAGSVFKKIEGYGAGRLIEQVGLKGKSIGGAKISDKHANFIVNTGNATAKDIRALIALVQQEVKQKLGLDMQTEISFIGEF